MAKSTIKLLPCPFCGSEIFICRIHSTYFTDTTESSIGCDKCDYVFSKRVTYVWSQHLGMHSIRDAVEKDLAFRWNRRAQVS